MKKDNIVGYMFIIGVAFVMLIFMLDNVEKRFVPRTEYDGFKTETKIQYNNVYNNMCEIKGDIKELRIDIKKLLERD